MSSAPAAPPPTTQLPLFPERPLTVRDVEQVTLDRFPDDALLEGPPPSAALVDSIRRWGVLEPVIVRAVGGGLDYADPRTLVSGRRRLKAVRRLQAEYQTQVRMFASRAPEGAPLNDETAPGYRAAYERYRNFQRIPVRVISDPEGLVGDGRTETLVLTTNAVRADNPVADYRAVVALTQRFVDSGLSEREAVGEVAKATGLAVGTVKQRLRLLGLTAELLDDFLFGRLPYSVALEAARLGPESQALFAQMLDDGQAPTLALVKQAKREAVAAHQASLLDALPEADVEAMADAYRQIPLPRRAEEAARTLRETRLPVCVEGAEIIEALLDALRGRREDALERGERDG